ncbi:hypothetical protein LUZ60_000347 [Juncus effusus]|nr:hypothetical protein LUZ60_000347 [Juncus effusus]
MSVAAAVRENLRGKNGQTMVKRYWPGKAPEWADAAADDDITGSRNGVAVMKDEKAFESSDDVAVMRDDGRLRRLAEGRVENREEIRADHRRIRQAESVEEEHSKQEEEDDQAEIIAGVEDEEAKEEKRRRILEKNLQRDKEEAASLIPAEEEEDEEWEEEEEELEEEELEYENDSTGGITMIKPDFNPKSERDKKRKRDEEEERRREELVKKRMQEKKAETKRMLVEAIRNDREIQKNLEKEVNVEDVDADDELNAAEEYEAWKVRELARIKRDREDREARAKERREIEKVRNMTEEERREWERRNPKLTTKEKKQKVKFMQRFYHKGAYFQAELDEIYRRDFSAPTGEDKLDKSILPEVMQVKHFGRSGRTKWTHLLKEDTTDWNSPWTENGHLRAKYNAKMAGMRPIAKPKGSKKLKYNAKMTCA